MSRANVVLALVLSGYFLLIITPIPIPSEKEKASCVVEDDVWTVEETGVQTSDPVRSFCDVCAQTVGTVPVIYGHIDDDIAKDIRTRKLVHGGCAATPQWGWWACAQCCTPFGVDHRAWAKFLEEQ